MSVSLFRTSIRSGSLLFAGLLSMAAWAGKAPDDVAAGQTLYLNTCGGCHSVDTDRIGPRHRNVVGRTVASVQGYDYSPALKKLGGIWTPARLDQWLSGTQKMAPGSRMYLELDDADVRRSIIAYLQSVSLPATPRDPRMPTRRGIRSGRPVPDDVTNSADGTNYLVNSMAIPPGSKED